MAYIAWVVRIPDQVDSVQRVIEDVVAWAVLVEEQGMEVVVQIPSVEKLFVYWGQADLAVSRELLVEMAFSQVALDHNVAEQMAVEREAGCQASQQVNQAVLPVLAEEEESALVACEVEEGEQLEAVLRAVSEEEHDFLVQ